MESTQNLYVKLCRFQDQKSDLLLEPESPNKLNLKCQELELESEK